MGQEKLRNKIMLVDDDPVTNFIHTRLIASAYDCEIGVYTEAQTALEYLKTPGNSSDIWLPSLVLLDINMPGMNGWSFLSEFEKLPVISTSRCKIYVVSSSIDRDDEEKSKLYNSVSGFISKPLTVDMVRELMVGI